MRRGERARMTSSRMRQLTAEVRTPSTRLTITETSTAVTITNDRGQARTFHPGAREDVLQLDEVPVAAIAKWEAGRLVVLYKVEEGRELRYTYSSDCRSGAIDGRRQVRRARRRRFGQTRLRARRLRRLDDDCRIRTANISRIPGPARASPSAKRRQPIRRRVPGAGPGDWRLHPPIALRLRRLCQQRPTRSSKA